MRARNAGTHSLTCGIVSPPLNLPIISPNPYILNRFTSNIPLPTLYAGDSVRKPKLSVIEVLLYNMAALLAGVAAGYDVRISNVSPVHPTLLNDVPALKAPLDMEYPRVLDVDRRFALNTYHGTGKQNRTPLTNATYHAASSEEPDMHTQFQSATKREVPSTLLPYYTKFPTAGNTPKHQKSPHHYQQQLPLTLSSTSGHGSNFTTNTSAMLSSYSGGNSHTQPPTPSPRRKISTSSFTEVLEYSTNEDEEQLDHKFNDFHIESGFEPTPVGRSNDYLRNGPSFSNDCGVYAHRTGYFGSNYFPYQPEMNSSYERDCKSYPDYSYDYNHRLPNYYDFNIETRQQIHTPPPKVPQMGVSASGHRRTSSSISSNSNQIIPAYQYEIENQQNQTELYDYDDLNTNKREKIYCERSQTPPPAPTVPTIVSAVPAPTKQELYRSSPKRLNRSNRIGNEFNEDIVGSTSYSNRLFEYEQQKFNASYDAMSPSHKVQNTISKLPQQRHVYSTPMSPVNMRVPFNVQQQQQQERPASLPFKHVNSIADRTSSTNKLRSSMKRFNLKTPNGATYGTPNPNPTPDSVTSDDSSYVSAKDGSISSQQSRVRFSPDPGYVDATTGTDSVIQSSTLHLPNHHELIARSSMLLLNRRINRRHTSDMSANSASTSPTSSSS